MITINLSAYNSDANLREALVSQIEAVIRGFEAELNENKAENETKEKIHYSLRVDYHSEARPYWPQIQFRVDSPDD